MTISNSTAKTVQVTNASLSAYSFPFKIFNAAELAVSCVDSATRMENRLILQKDFTVSGLNSDSGGLVVLTAAGQDAAGTGNNLVIRRDMGFVQNMDIRPHDVMPAETLERAFDILTMETQQLKEEIRRALVAPPDRDKAITWNEIAGLFNQAAEAAGAAKAAAAEISAGRAETRRRLAGDTTYYLRADGHDAGDGLSAAGAFATCSRFLDELNRLDGAGFTVTLDVGAGTFGPIRDFGNVPGVRRLLVKGAGPDTVVSGIYFEQANALLPCPVMFEDMSLSSNSDYAVSMRGVPYARFKNITFPVAPRWGFIDAANSRLMFAGAVSFPAGSVYACFYSRETSSIILEPGLVINFADGLAFRSGYGFLVGYANSFFQIPANMVSNGNPGGQKYRLGSGTGIVTNAGDQIIPGTLAGIKDATSWLM